MKTISFEIGSALLFRRDHSQDQQEATRLKIEAIDLVVCNLYPFEKAVRENQALPVLVENIDIGGPTMVRAAAKNFNHVSCVVSASDYPVLMQEWKTLGGISLETRQRLALKAFEVIAGYDLAIAMELSKQFGAGLRYGENPHQRATLLHIPNTDATHTLADARFLQGKELSYNNLLDADQAYKCASELGVQGPVCVIIKHGIPCGVAAHSDPLKALDLAWNADSVSSFGSVICMNTPVTESMATWMKDKFVEVILAPTFEKGALALYAGKKNLRLLEVEMKPQSSSEWTVRSINGGLLCQDEDRGVSTELKSVTQKTFPTELEKVTQFGLIVTKYLKSNCIGLFGKKENGTVVIASGVGQPNRLDCITRLAGPRAKEKNEDLSNAVLVSDAFFPFRDSIEAAHSIGIHYIVQPGGSVRDAEVISACDEFGIAMLMTGKRHFRH